MSVRYFETLDEAKLFLDKKEVLHEIFKRYEGIEHVGIGLDNNGYFVQVVVEWNLAFRVRIDLGVKLVHGDSKLVEWKTEKATDTELIKKRGDLTHLPSIQPGMGVLTGGAIGLIVYKNSEKHFLSCDHVFSSLSRGIRLNDYGWKDHKVANYMSPPDKSLDCAIARVETSYLSKLDRRIKRINAFPRQSASPNLNQEVIKYGPSTGKTVGYVRLVHVRKTLDQRHTFFEVQPVPKENSSFADKGDSGSVVLSRDNKLQALGMIVTQVRFDQNGLATSHTGVKKGCLCVLLNDIVNSLSISLTKQ